MPTTSILSDEQLEFYKVDELVYVWSDDLISKQEVGIILEINKYRYFSYLVLVGDKKIPYSFDYLEKFNKKLDNKQEVAYT